jgi:hypothetical protein
MGIQDRPLDRLEKSQHKIGWGMIDDRDRQIPGEV